MLAMPTKYFKTKENRAPGFCLPFSAVQWAVEGRVPEDSIRNEIARIVESLLADTTLPSQFSTLVQNWREVGMEKIARKESSGRVTQE
jgi:hypothetical protein